MRGGEKLILYAIHIFHESILSPYEALWAGPLSRLASRAGFIHHNKFLSSLIPSCEKQQQTLTCLLIFWTSHSYHVYPKAGGYLIQSYAKRAIHINMHWPNVSSSSAFPSFLSTWCVLASPTQNPQKSPLWMLHAKEQAPKWEIMNAYKNNEKDVNLIKSRLLFQNAKEFFLGNMYLFLSL